MKALNINQATELLENDIKSLENKIEKEKIESYKAKSIDVVLKELLSNIKPIDFHEKAEKDNHRHISVNEYIVIIVEELNEILANTSFGLRSFGDILFLYNGCYWTELTNSYLEQFLIDISIKMGVPPIKAKHNKFTNDLKVQFLKRTVLPEIEQNEKTLINLLNGTFEVNDEIQELREPRKDDFLKYQLPFLYDAGAKCPLFDKFLNRVLPDQELETVLMEFIGYVFIKSFSLQKSLILKGNGANGKSVLFEIITAVLGDNNVSSYSLQNITQSNSYSLPYLNSKLLNYSSEIGKIVDIDLFKKLVSNEIIDARKIYGEPFKFKSYAKLMFNCNEVPSNTEQTDAFFRRFIIIPFNATIGKEEQDPLLSNKIISKELSGIFNKILIGLQNVLKNKSFSNSDIIDKQLTLYRTESDSVALFIDENNYKEVDDTFISLKDLYAEYRAYCVTNGYYAVSNINFSKRLESLGYSKKRL